MSGILNLSPNLLLSRRQFIAAGAAGSLVLGFRLPLAASAAQANGVLNAFVAIDPSGTITVQSPFVEMGQGIYTMMSMLVAEELGADMRSMRTVQAPPGAAYMIVREGERFTGGDESTRSAYEPLRRAGAVARHMLVQAAAGRLNVQPDALTTRGGYVVHKASGKRIAFGDLVADAAGLDVPAEVQLKSPAEFQVLRKTQARLDIPAKTDGSAVFGVDELPDNVAIAVVRQAPVFGGTVKRMRPESVTGRRGVIAVEEVPNGVAVIADNYWRAMKALNALDVEFAPGPAPDFTSAKHEELLRGKLDARGATAEEVGDLDGAFAGADRTLEMDYVIPFAAHTTMEPMTCTALVTDDRCVVWTPNQGVDFIVYAATNVTGLPAEAVEVHTPFLGGAFGRRFMLDFPTQAVTLANRHKGRPIKLIWSREEDTRHDFYRPMLAARQRAALDKEGKLVGWHSRIAGMGPYTQVFPDEVEAHGWDFSVMQGMLELPYRLPNRRMEYVHVQSPAPIGFWRTTGYGPTCYFKESALDEIAHAVGRDPYEYRRELLADAKRECAVLDKAAELAGWRKKPFRKNGTHRAHGIALHNAFDSINAQVAEVSISDDGTVRVHKVYCAMDCGLALNPLNVIMQMESGIAFGLSATLHEEVVMRDGRAVPGNFHEYPILRPGEMPEVEVAIIDSGAKIGGAGEIATCPVAPAVCNAVFALTGERIRRLPIGTLV